ncbi:MAG: sulfotransferase family protein [Bacteroidota bacterium]
MSSKLINMWSGPRNISTAIMYSFAQRSDTKVVDEPFYAHYLLQSGAEHPARAKVLDSQPKDPAVSLQNLLAASHSSEVLFVKNMAHHMIEMEDTLDKLISVFEPIFLIRDPAEMLLSLDKSLPNPMMRDTGYQHLIDLFNKAKKRGLSLTVIDSKELLQNPEGVLTALCKQLEIPFEQSMLSWDAGPIAEDGIWAEHWYHNVHSSTGFNPYIPKDESLPEHLTPLYKQCKPIYDKMFAHAIKN